MSYNASAICDRDIFLIRSGWLIYHNNGLYICSIDFEIQLESVPTIPPIQTSENHTHGTCGKKSFQAVPFLVMWPTEQMQ